MGDVFSVSNQRRSNPFRLIVVDWPLQKVERKWKKKLKNCLDLGGGGDSNTREFDVEENRESAQWFPIDSQCANVAFNVHYSLGS